MPQHVVEDEDIHPVGVVMIVIRNRRPSVDNRLIRVMGEDAVHPFVAYDLHILHPIVVERGDPVFRHQFEEIFIQNTVFQCVIMELKACGPGCPFAFLHVRFHVRR